MPPNAATRTAGRALLFLVGATFLAAATPARPYQLPANASSAPNWVLGDVNGDRIADLADAGPGLRDGRGYIHEVKIDLSGFQSTSLLIRGQSRSIRLSFRDVDGDHDRDLIVLEPWSSQPVGIWLNDGAGHFEEANLEDYRAKLDRPGPSSFTSLTGKSGCLPALYRERTQIEALDSSLRVFDRSSVLISWLPATFPAALRRSGTQPRAPPCLL